MRTPDRLALTLQRIEDFLSVLRLEDFGLDVEGGQRVLDDLHFLHRELKAGRKTLPLPSAERRPLNIAYGYDGHFNESLTELHDRVIDLLYLFDANRWPLLPWQAEPLNGTIPDPPELHALYGILRHALSEKRLDDAIGLLTPVLHDITNALGRDHDFDVRTEKNNIGLLMRDPDFRVDAPPPGEALIEPMFDGCRVRLVHPTERRHALGLFPYTSIRTVYALPLHFGRIEGRWAIVGYE